jgi:hypothetical protein
VRLYNKKRVLERGRNRKNLGFFFSDDTLFLYLSPGYALRKQKHTQTKAYTNMYVKNYYFFLRYCILFLFSFINNIINIAATAVAAEEQEIIKYRSLWYNSTNTQRNINKE